jgi:hypothetical protein
VLPDPAAHPDPAPASYFFFAPSSA